MKPKSVNTQPGNTQLATNLTAPESIQETLTRLAGLSDIDYDRCRKVEADRLGIRLDTLDAERAKLRPSATPGANLPGHTVHLPDPEPWPSPVDGAEVLNAVSNTFSRYAYLPPGAADALALWVAHSHAFETFIHTPRLNLRSPEKGCGKTLLLDVLAALTPRPLRTENLTCAVLFRLVEMSKPTLLLDEVDCFLAESDELRGLLNAGHKRGACAYRVEGDSHEVRSYSAFAPAVLAGIGHLDGKLATLHDRSIVVELTRARPGEVLARFDPRRIQAETALCRQLARWTADNRATLEACDPALPEGVFNRLADNWRPLFAIAEVAGADWPRRAAEALTKLTPKGDHDAQGWGVMLLADIATVFAETGTDRLFSKALVAHLCALTHRPWPEARDDKPISESWLARRLRRFNVTPKTLRQGEERAKGYARDDFQDAWARFLPEAGGSSRDTVTNPVNTGENSLFNPCQAAPLVTLPNMDGKPVSIDLSRRHASETPDQRERAELQEVLV